MPYAEGTQVSQAASVQEIERILRRFGASAFMYGWTDEGAQVGFAAEGRKLRFAVPMPDRDDPVFTETPTGRSRSNGEAEKAWEAEVRRRWRALALVVKAKLEAVASGIAHFEEEFLAYIILPDGRTYGDLALPEIATVYATGRMPTSLLALNVGDES